LTRFFRAGHQFIQQVGVDLEHDVVPFGLLGVWEFILCFAAPLSSGKLKDPHGKNSELSLLFSTSGNRRYQSPLLPMTPHDIVKC